MKGRGFYTHAVARLYLGSSPFEAPLRHVVLTSRDLCVDKYDSVVTHLLNGVGCEVDDGAVLRLVRKTRRVREGACLSAVVPLGARACYALLIALIQNHVAFGYDAVCSFINSYLVGLKAVRPYARVNVTFVNKYERILRPR